MLWQPPMATQSEAAMSIPAQNRHNGEDEPDTPASGPQHLRSVPPGGIPPLPAPQSTEMVHCPRADDPEDPEPKHPSGFTVAQNTSSQHPGVMVQMYLSYFHALLRFLQKDAVYGRMIDEAHQADREITDLTLLGIGGINREHRLELHQFQWLIDFERSALPKFQPGYYFRRDEIAPLYTELYMQYERAQYLPGMPTIGPWWLAPLRPLLRRCAFGWLRREHDKHLHTDN